MTESVLVDEGAEIVPFQRPQLPDLRNASTDSWTSVVEEVGTLAGRIADTEFVPKELRGNGAAVAACILAGREVGMAPMTALQTINVIHGKPAISAEGMRGLVLQAGHSIQLVEKSASRVIIRGRRRGDNEWSTISWTVDDARRAGLGGDNWKKYPRAMLTARATTELCRDLFADVVHGLRSVEEMADELDQLSVMPPPPPEPTTTVKRRGRPPKKKTESPDPWAVENTPPDAQNPPVETPPDPPPTTTRKRPPLPSKRDTGSPKGGTTDDPTEPQPDSRSVEQRQEEIRQLSEERRQVLGAPDATVARPTRADDPKRPAGRTPPPTLTIGQRTSIMMHFARLDMATDRDERLWWTNKLLDLDPDTIKSANELTPDQAETLIRALERHKDREHLESILQPTLVDPPEVTDE